MRERRSFGRLRKLPSGNWQAAYVGPDLRTHKAHSTFTTKLNAESWLMAERELIELDKWEPPITRRVAKYSPGITLADYSIEWIAARRTKRGPIRPSTRAEYERLLARTIIPVLGARQVKTITHSDVDQWWNELASSKPTERARAYGLLHAIMQTAAEDPDAIIARNPVHIRGAGSVERSHEIIPATLEEIATIVDAMPDRLALAPLLGAWCSTRWGELAELRRKDLASDGSLVKVRRDLGEW